MRARLLLAQKQAGFPQSWDVFEGENNTHNPREVTVYRACSKAFVTRGARELHV